MNKMVLNVDTESYPVELYDMSIEDVEERRSKKIIFATAMKAANFLGIPPNKFYERIGIGKYAYAHGTDKKYAVRKVFSK